MSPAPYRIEALGKQDRSGFDCGEPALDEYFRYRVTQDIRRHVTACFVAIETSSGALAGYYTLAATHVSIGDVPAELARRLPHYPTIPAARLGRLAVDHRFRGQGLGSAMLIDAALRAGRSEVAIYAMIVDAKNDDAKRFYLHHGFSSLGSEPRRLFAALATLAGPTG